MFDTEQKKVSFRRFQNV